MSDAFYTGMRDTVAGPLIEKYGMALTLKRITPGIYNPNTGSDGGDVTAIPTTYPCFGLVEEYSEYMIAGSLVKRGDKKLLLSAKGLTITPQIGDIIVMSDGNWFIPEGGGQETSSFQPIIPLAPGGIPVMYTIQIRK